MFETFRADLQVCFCLAHRVSTMSSHHNLPTGAPPFGGLDDGCSVRNPQGLEKHDLPVVAQYHGRSWTALGPSGAIGCCDGVIPSSLLASVGQPSARAVQVSA